MRYSKLFIKYASTFNDPIFSFQKSFLFKKKIKKKEKEKIKLIEEKYSL